MYEASGSVTLIGWSPPHRLTGQIKHQLAVAGTTSINGSEGEVAPSIAAGQRRWQLVTAEPAGIETLLGMGSHFAPNGTAVKHNAVERDSTETSP